MLIFYAAIWSYYQTAIFWEQEMIAKAVNTYVSTQNIADCKVYKLKLIP